MIAEVLNCDTMVLKEQVKSNDEQIKVVNQTLDKLTPVSEELNFLLE